MKLLIASDLHGSAFYTEKLLERYAKEGAERLILLGDILYHGPRNDLPERYAPKEVLAMLNPHAAEILCVRGNCDCEVDQMVLDFPVLADYGFLLLEGRAAYLTHGHVINKAHPLSFQKGDILLHGHVYIHEQYSSLQDQTPMKAYHKNARRYWSQFPHSCVHHLSSLYNTNCHVK